MKIYLYIQCRVPYNSAKFQLNRIINTELPIGNQPVPLTLEHKPSFSGTQTQTWGVANPNLWINKTQFSFHAILFLKYATQTRLIQLSFDV